MIDIYSHCIGQLIHQSKCSNTFNAKDYAWIKSLHASASAGLNRAIIYNSGIIPVIARARLETQCSMQRTFGVVTICITNCKKRTDSLQFVVHMVYSYLRATESGISFGIKLTSGRAQTMGRYF
jgi:hypothetical protein